MGKYKGALTMIINPLFQQKIELLQTQLLEKIPLIHNEENTKQSLINPFLIALG